MSDVKVSKPMVTDIFVEGAKKRLGYCDNINRA